MPRSTNRGARAVTLGILLSAALGTGAFFLWQARDRTHGASGTPGTLPQGRAARLPSDTLYALDPYLDPGQPAATIEGQVVDSNLMPVDGATVTLARTRRHAHAPFSDLDVGRTVEISRTSGSGRFRFEQVIAGWYILSAMADKHGPASVGPMALSTGETKTQTIRLTQAGSFTLTGQVLDVAGAAIAGAKVRVIESSTAAGVVPPVFQTTSDESGRYEMSLAPANYSLLADAEGRIPARDWFTLAAQQTRDLRLAPAARIIGRVVERGSNKPVPDADLWLLRQRPGASAFTRDVRSDRTGGFVFSGLEPGTYRMGVRKERLVGMSGPVSITPGQTTSDVIVVEASPGRAIAGRVVTTAGAAVPGARIDLVKAEPPAERPIFIKAEPDGRFLLEGVLPAQYRLDVTADLMARSTQELRVTNDLPTLEIKLHPEASLRARVVTTDTRPVEGAAVTVEMTRPGAAAGGLREVTTTGADGNFELRNLPAGELTVTAQHAVHGVVTHRGQKLVDGQRASLTLRLAPVTGGRGASKAVAAFALATGNSRINGEVSAPGGQAVLGAAITAAPELRAPPGRAPLTIARTSSGVDGAFELSRLPPGKHTLWATHPGFADVRLEGVEADGPAVRLQFPPAAAISGWVETRDGRPASDYTVTVAGTVANGVAASIEDRRLVDTVHDPKGHFFLGGLPPGTHELRVRTAAGAHGVLAVKVAAGEHKQGTRIVLAK
jgi:hypothetical protein